MLHPLAEMAVVLALLAVVFAALALYRRLASPHAELVRKLLHVAAGLAALSFPWLFDAIWPVLALNVIGVALVMVLRTAALRETSLGQVLGGVSRFSLGDVYFPLSIAILWMLYLHAATAPTAERLLAYVIPILLVTLSDASAALVGVAYGRWQYATPDGFKSLEGSVAFFFCSFLCVHVSLLLGSDLGRVEVLLIAVLLSWLATMFEAIAWRGLDNLVLPLAAYLLLILYWDLPRDALLVRLAVTAAVFVFVLMYARQTTLAGSALLGAFLVGYICWALGGWKWFVPPLLVFVFHHWLWLGGRQTPAKIHTVHAVTAVSLAGLFWLFLSRLLASERWYYPFTVAFAAHLAIFGMAQLCHDAPQAAWQRQLAVTAGKSWLLLFAGYVAIRMGLAAAWLEAALALPLVAAAAGGFYSTQPHMHDCPLDTARWLRQGAWAGAASALAAASLAFQP